MTALIRIFIRINVVRKYSFLGHFICLRTFNDQLGRDAFGPPPPFISASRKFRPCNHLQHKNRMTRPILRLKPNLYADTVFFLFSTKYRDPK